MAMAYMIISMTHSMTHSSMTLISTRGVMAGAGRLGTHGMVRSGDGTATTDGRIGAMVQDGILVSFMAVAFPTSTEEDSTVAAEWHTTARCAPACLPMVVMLQQAEAV